jgi:hypothetical protein
LKPIFSSFLKRQWKGENKLPEAYVLILDPKIGKPMMPPKKCSESFYLAQDKLMSTAQMMWVSRVH